MKEGLYSKHSGHVNELPGTEETVDIDLLKILSSSRVVQNRFLVVTDVNHELRGSSTDSTNGGLTETYLHLFSPIGYLV